MGRFNTEAYDKLFPRQKDITPIETPVPTFTPTKDKLEDESVMENESPIDVEDGGKEVEDGNNDNNNGIDN